MLTLLNRPSNYFKKVITAISHPKIRTISTSGLPLNFQVTPNLFAEPLKKKRKLDPAILKAREERKRKRLEKQIRRLQKNALQLKPIDELEIPMAILNEKVNRLRKNPPLTEESLNHRIRILKNWTMFKQKQHLQTIQMIDRIVLSQQWALDQLRLESEELYKSAIQVDESLIPFKTSGPVETPPIPCYDSPDGEYIDISKKWDTS